MTARPREDLGHRRRLVHGDPERLGRRGEALDQFDRVQPGAVRGPGRAQRAGDADALGGLLARRTGRGRARRRTARARGRPSGGRTGRACSATSSTPPWWMSASMPSWAATRTTSPTVSFMARWRRHRGLLAVQLARTGRGRRSRCRASRRCARRRRSRRTPAPGPSRAGGVGLLQVVRGPQPGVPAADHDDVGGRCHRGGVPGGRGGRRPRTRRRRRRSRRSLPSCS